MEGVGVDDGVDVGVGMDSADVGGILGLMAAILGVSLVIGTLHGPKTGCCLYCGGGDDEVVEARRGCVLLVGRSG